MSILLSSERKSLTRLLLCPKNSVGDFLGFTDPLDYNLVINDDVLMIFFLMIIKYL